MYSICTSIYRWGVSLSTWIGPLISTKTIIGLEPGTKEDHNLLRRTKGLGEVNWTSSMTKKLHVCASITRRAWSHEGRVGFRICVIIAQSGLLPIIKYVNRACIGRVGAPSIWRSISIWSSLQGDLEGFEPSIDPMALVENTARVASSERKTNKYPLTWHDDIQFMLLNNETKRKLDSRLRNYSCAFIANDVWCGRFLAV